MSGKEWYVAFGIANGTKMTVAADRDAAIQTACSLLDQGIDVTEVGPMIEPPEGRIINAQDIRALWARRAAA